jgi:hypothetical protein
MDSDTPKTPVNQLLSAGGNKLRPCSKIAGGGGISMSEPDGNALVALEISLALRDAREKFKPRELDFVYALLSVGHPIIFFETIEQLIELTGIAQKHIYSVRNPLLNDKVLEPYFIAKPEGAREERNVSEANKKWRRKAAGEIFGLAINPPSFWKPKRQPDPIPPKIKELRIVLASIRPDGKQAEMFEWPRVTDAARELLFEINPTRSAGGNTGTVCPSAESADEQVSKDSFRELGSASADMPPSPGPEDRPSSGPGDGQSADPCAVAGQSKSDPERQDGLPSPGSTSDTTRHVVSNTPNPGNQEQYHQRRGIDYELKDPGKTESESNTTRDVVFNTSNSAASAAPSTVVRGTEVSDAGVVDALKQRGGVRGGEARANTTRPVVSTPGSDRAPGALVTYAQEADFLDYMAAILEKRLSQAEAAQVMHSWRGFWRLRYRKYPQICEKALTELNERTSKPKPFDRGPGEYLRWCYETGLYMAGIRQTPPRRRPG